MQQNTAKKSKSAKTVKEQGCELILCGKNEFGQLGVGSELEGIILEKVGDILLAKTMLLQSSNRIDCMRPRSLSATFR